MPLANHFHSVGVGKDEDNYFIYATSDINEICYLCEDGEWSFNKSIRGEIDDFPTVIEIFEEALKDKESIQDLNLMFSF